MKRNLLIAVQVILYVLLGIVFLMTADCLLPGESGNENGIVIYVIELLAVVSAFLYALKGHGKKAAAYFKGFLAALWIFSVASAVAEVNSFFHAGTAAGLELGLELLAISLISVLLFAEDLGHIRSLWFCALTTLIELLAYGNHIARMSENGFSVPAIIAGGALPVLAGILLLMTVLKYSDKAARGSD